MPSVSVEATIPAGPSSGRTRGNRDATPNDIAAGFAALVENDAGPQPTAGLPDDITRKPPAKSLVEPNADAASAAESTAAVTLLAESAAVPAPAVRTGVQMDNAADVPVVEPVAADEASVTASDQTASRSDAAIPVAVFVGLQENVARSPTSVIDSSEGIPSANSAAIPGGTAALALARVAQDAEQIDPATTEMAADPQAPATPPTDADRPLPPVPAIVAAAPDQNAPLETAAELTSRIPAEAAAVEADLELQAAVTAPAEAPEDHARLIASSPGLPAQDQPKLSAVPEQTTAKPGLNPSAAAPADRRVTTSDVNSSGERKPGKPSSVDTTDGSSPPLQATDRVPAVQATAADHTALRDPASGMFTTPAAVQANNHVQPLTVASANPTAPIPIAGLAVEIAANAQIGRSRFEIRLDPPELGRIEVRLDVDRQGQVTSHMIVEKAATLDLLRRDAPQLERALQDAGLKTSDSGLQFSLRDQQSQADRRDSDHNGRHQRLTVTEDDTIPREAAGRTYGRMLGQRGGIDMRV